MSAVAPTSTGARIAALDGIRGLAAVAVVLYHLTSKFQHLYGLHPYTGFPAYPDHPGRYGVEVFFVLSGMVIFLSLRRVHGVADFAFRRFARLYPVYWACVLTTWLVAWWAAFPTQVGALELLVNATMLQGLVGVAHVDPSYWSLGFELVFYGIAAFAMSAGLTSRPWLLAWGLVAVSALWGGALTALRVEVPLVPGMFAAPYAHLFGAGIAISEHHRDGARRWPAGVVLAAVAVHVMLMANPSDKFNPLAVGVVCLSLPVLWHIHSPRLRWLGSRPLRWLGRVSYALYLVHQIVGYVLLRWAYGHTQSTALALTLTIAVVVTLSWVLTEYVEQPATRALNRWWRGRSGAPAGSPSEAQALEP